MSISEKIARPFKIHVQYSDDGAHIRKWDRKPFEGSQCYVKMDAGRFSDFSLDDLAGQCRMQARDNLDPEYSQFMWAVATALADMGKAVAGERERCARIAENAIAPTLGGAAVRDVIASLIRSTAPASGGGES